MSIKQGTDDLNALEESFGIPRGYIDSLIKEDDWTLMLKAQALLESACADMLTRYFGNHKLADIFANLDMSNERYGKIAFLSNLNLLGKKERGFLRKLSSLRNEIVHNASNVTFNLQDYVSELSPTKLTAFADTINIRLESIKITDIDKTTKTLTGKRVFKTLCQPTSPQRLIWSSSLPGKWIVS